MHLTLTEPLKNRLPILIALLVYLAFVIVDLSLGTFELKHLYTFPLIALALFVPIIMFTVPQVAIIIILWMSENLTWTIISFAIILAGLIGAIVVI